MQIFEVELVKIITELFMVDQLILCTKNDKLKY